MHDLGLTRPAERTARGRGGRCAVGWLVATLLLAGCFSGARTGAVDSVVPVDLANFKITMPTHVRAGVIKFALTGVGPTMHEFNIARTDAAPSALVLSADGSVSDQTEHGGFEHIAEREAIDIGAHSSLTVRLYPGHYVLYCNMYGHYQAGMNAEVTVP